MYDMKIEGAFLTCYEGAFLTCYEGTFLTCYESNDYKPISKVPCLSVCSHIRFIFTVSLV